MFRRRFLKRKDNGISFVTGDNTLTCRQTSGAQPDIYTTGTYHEPNCDWNTTSANVYVVPLYNNSLNYAIGSITTGRTYVIVINDPITSASYLVGTNNDLSLQYRLLTDNMTVYDSAFLWNVVINNSKYQFYKSTNDPTISRYAKVDDKGNFGAVDTDSQPETYFTISTSSTSGSDGTVYSHLLSYTYKSQIYYPQPVTESNGANVKLSSTSSYHVYAYTISSDTNTFTRITTSAADFLNNNVYKYLILNNGTKYYLFRRPNFISNTLSIIDMGTPTVSSAGTVLSFSSNRNYSSYLSNARMTIDNGSEADYYIFSQTINTRARYLLQPAVVENNTYGFTSTSSSSVHYTDADGLCPEAAYDPGPFGGTNIRPGYMTTQSANNAGGALLLDAATGTVQSSIGTGTYALVIVNEEGYYDLISHDGDDLLFTRYDDLSDITIGEDAHLTVVQQTNGYGLFFGSYGLNSSNNELKLLAVSLDWAYAYDASDADNSRLCSVSTSTTDYYTEYANSDLEANTQATDTTCDVFLVQNGKVQIQADEFVDGQTYVLVFVDNGNHYAACVNGTDIVPVLYANSLPKNLPSDYHFVAEASGQGFLLKHNNQAMGVAVNTKLTIGYNAIWTYTGGTNE